MQPCQKVVSSLLNSYYGKLAQAQTPQHDASMSLCHVSHASIMTKNVHVSAVFLIALDSFAGEKHNRKGTSCYPRGLFPDGPAPGMFCRSSATLQFTTSFVAGADLQAAWKVCGLRAHPAPIHLAAHHPGNSVGNSCIILWVHPSLLLLFGRRLTTFCRGP